MSKFGRLAPPPQPEKIPPTPVKIYPGVRTLFPRPEVSQKAAAIQPNVFQRVCLIAVGIYLLSGYVNDITLRLLHNKAYISLVTVFVIPVFFVLTGAVTRGLRHPIGKLWLAFAVCLALSLPFSIWRGGTFGLLENYYGKAYVIYFYLCACIVSGRQLRWLMNILLIGAYSLIVVCFAFGSDASGRFSVPGSIFFSNANELGLQLLLNVVFLLYVFFTNKNMLWKIISFPAMGLSVQYMLKTGSRAEFLGFLIVIVMVFLFGRKKLMFVAICMPAMCLLLFLLPSSTLHRFTYIFMNPSDAVATTLADQATLDSQMERQQLLLDSISYSFQYPLFGVGAGQFAVRVAGDKEKRGEHPEWLGTHNTYTQISSETGLPAFVFYTLAIILCVRMNYGVFRKTAGRVELQEYHAVGFCMFLATIAYAFSTFFFHVAYSGYFPLIAGISVANYLTAKPFVDELRTGPVSSVGGRYIRT